MTVFEGRPGEKRTEQEETIYDRLDALHIAFQRVDHDPADNMEACRAIGEALGGRVCKNLFLCNRQQTAFYLLLMPEEKPFKTKFLSGQLNCARLSFATPEALGGLLRTRPGSASPLELLFDTAGQARLIVDRDLTGDADICCHPGFSTSTVKLSWTDMKRYLESVGHPMTVVELPDTAEEA